MRTPRSLTTTAAVMLAAGAAASPALAAAGTPRQDLRMPDTRDVAAGRAPSTTARRSSSGSSAEPTPA